MDSYFFNSFFNICICYLFGSTGVLAMESLHRQVLPFLLRRMKEDVLKDLPPKIIQDYYCELSPLQVMYGYESSFNFLQCIYLYLIKIYEVY